MSQKDSDKLLPCPFCGHTVIVCETGRGIRNYTIQCLNICLVQPMVKSSCKDSVTKAWNTRQATDNGKTVGDKCEHIHFSDAWDRREHDRYKCSDCGIYLYNDFKGKISPPQVHPAETSQPTEPSGDERPQENFGSLGSFWMGPGSQSSDNKHSEEIVKELLKNIQPTEPPSDVVEKVAEAMWEAGRAWNPDKPKLSEMVGESSGSKEHWLIMAKAALSAAPDHFADSDKMVWQPMETAPKDGTWVLLSVGWDMPVVGRYDIADGQWHNNHYSNREGYWFFANPLYWRPIPALPKGDGDKPDEKEKE